MGMRIWALAVVVLALVPGAAAAAPDPPDPGRTTSGTVTSNGTDYEYLLYTPTSYRARRPAPLVVAIHGCQTTAEQHMRSTLFNQVAERRRFVTLYVDVDALGRTQPGPANQCWKFPYPPAYFRGGSDAAAIADMTRAAMAERAIDPQRVYVVGTSAGGLMAAVEAAAYPDLFAAVGIVAGAGYADGPCFTTGVGIPVETSAQLAFVQMGPRARVVPTFVIGSDADLAFPETCANKALEQGLRTNNLVLSGSQDGPIALTPAAVRQKRKPGGHAYTVSRYRDPNGCLIAERWIIHGMPHAWPGGTTDPKYAGFTDPKAPSGAKGSWSFFRRYTKRGTAMPCAERGR
jgi:poly(hydroxyalkanoate) depolymerase family esterase